MPDRQLPAVRMVAETRRRLAPPLLASHPRIAGDHRSGI